ncbi:MAG: arsenate reductase (glutaredoxin) [Brevundimonas sp.]|jgi:arsenate reductase|uniref:arsenate reductase (glutaredoxin) n=1 Tax=Brevundimonas sp. TaxID=1871086 RepID=UPI0022C595FC|nr:arsenate reductase (glutaredoxin) [Brevundimonas sp.]MCZ8087624.1 arsenate reductase (glutaredoxin) [Brevundimonas sp.]MCZ8194305.1 arsenate reductase (glutaredoxin) [Brevundimonas sp.]
MSDFPVTVFHNPACGTSRNVVAAVREAGLEPEVVEYLKAGWTRAQLEDLLARMGGARPREILRERGTPAAELGLLGEDVSDDTLLEAMVAHPILVDRPMVATPLGVVLARPSERVFEVLDRRPGSFTKEDGEVVEL